MEAVFPARGRRWRRQEPRQRHRTTPVTFAEIKEVDEEIENEEACAASMGNVTGELEQHHPELDREFAEFRKRRARRVSERTGVGNPAPAAAVTTISASAHAVTATCDPPKPLAPF